MFLVVYLLRYRERLDYVLGNNYLRGETLGLHFVRERIVSTDNRIRPGGDRVKDN